MAKFSKKLMVGTRASALALSQTKAFLQALAEKHSGLEWELKKITTSGDRIQDRFLSDVGGKGLFVKEIEDALLAQEIDLAVHSLKDLPAALPEGLEIACYPKRKPPWDVLVTQDGKGLDQLPQEAVVGTSSLRRRAQLKTLRKDLRFELLRGNIDTRLKKLSQGQFDAIVLAQAGMERLGLDLSHAVALPLVPAPGQGTLAIETRREDVSTKTLLQSLHDEATAFQAFLERRLMGAVGGDCNLPFGALAQLKNDALTLQIFLGLPDGSKTIAIKRQGRRDQGEILVEAILEELWQEGAKEIIAQI